MSEWITQREHFYKTVIAQGITTQGEVKNAFPLGMTVPDVKIGKWFKKLHLVPELGPCPKQWTCVNHFKLGADPEFVFTQMVNGGRDEEGDPIGQRETRVDAMNLSLKQGPAFGADNNGRLAEIRPHPSRSALTVLASTLATLRWLAATRPDINVLNWMSGAFLFRDGLGGHVHFGRKRPTSPSGRRQRTPEIMALDVVFETLLALGVFPKNEVRLRQAGDARGQVYGRPGDFRMQKHGYEYRTFPSWLDNPWLAYFTLVVSKLSVHSPELVCSWTIGSPKTKLRQVENLLAFYKDIDDDAKLAWVTLKRIGWPTHAGGDFRGRWGLTHVAHNKAVRIIPMTIPAAREDVLALYDNLAFGKEIPGTCAEPSWTPIAPKEGFSMCIDLTETVQQKGLGELIWDMVSPVDMNIRIVGSRVLGNAPILVSSALTKWLPKDWKYRLKKVVGKDVQLVQVASDDNRAIHIDGGIRETNPGVVRRILLSGVFPLWKAGTESKEAYGEWGKMRESGGEKVRKYYGKMVFASRDLVIRNEYLT